MFHFIFNLQGPTENCQGEWAPWINIIIIIIIKGEPTNTSASGITPSHTESSEEKHQSDDDDDDNSTKQTLPFKVMGVAYSAENYKHLENAFQILR